MDNAPHLVARGGQASLIGSALGGYKVQALIGRGAMGTVYLARDTALNRPVALKVLLGSLARNPSMVRSFYREAQAAAPLRHPCVVRIYSAGVEAGTPYIAMEYVAGEPLDRFLRRKGTVNWQTVLYVGAQLARALECAHGAGVIHRDVKPANILLDRQGRVRLTDFGIARVATLDARGNRTAGIMGTPTYMSPEQCEGADLEPATDLYSLGVVLFQLMAGYPPFRAESSQALVKQILTDDAPRLNKLLPEIPDDVARLVAHLLQKESGARPRSAAHVVKIIERIRTEEGGRSAIPEALAAFVREQAVESNLRLMTPPPQWQGRKGKTSPNTGHDARASRYRVPVMVAVGILVLMVLVAGFMLLGHRTHGLVPAPPLTAFRFHEEADGALHASAVLDGFVFHELRWAGDTLVVEARGRCGSLLDGATGLLAVDPGGRQCLSLHAPNTPFTVEPDALTPVPLTYRIPADDAGGLGSTVLMTRYVQDEAVQFVETEFLPQPVTAAFPRPTPLYREAIVQAAGMSIAPAPAIALHPDGRHFCVAAHDSQGTRLMEFGIQQRGDSSQSGKPLTPVVPSIVPGTAQYSLDGERVAYIREKPNAVRELWIMPRTSDQAGVVLAVGNVDTSYAVNPDGRYAVLSVREPNALQSDLRVVDATTGNVLTRLGRGTVGVEAWLPSGEAFVITRGEPAQAWLVPLATPSDARPLTQFEHGVRGHAAVSPDGQWVAVIAHRRSDQSVAFIPIDSRTTTLARAGGTDRTNPSETSL